MTAADLAPVPEAVDWSAPRFDPRWHLLLFVLLVLPCVLGSLSAYLALAATLLYLPELWRRGTLRLIVSEPMFQYEAIALLALLVAFTVAAHGWRDPLYVINFVVLLVAGLAYAAGRRHAGPAAVVGIAAYALAGSVVAIVAGLFDIYVRDMHRAGWLAGNPIHYADVTSALGWLALVGVFASQGRRRWLFLLGPVLGAAATQLAQARGAALAYPVLALIAMVILFQALPKARGLLLGAAGLLLLTGVIFLLLPGRIGALWRLPAQIMQSGTTSDLSANIRLNLWHAASAAFLEAPIFGHGWHNFYAAAIKLLPAAVREKLPGFRHLHSDIFDFAVAAGTVGIAAYVTIIVAPVASALANLRGLLAPARLYGMLTLSVGYFIYGLTNLMFGFELQTNLYALVAALLLGATAPPPLSPPSPSPAAGRPAPR